jgi:hypothetical protein
VHLSADVVQWIAVGAAAGALVAFVVGVAVGVRLRRLRRAYVGVRAAAEGGLLLERLSEQQRELEALRAAVGNVGVGLEGTRAELADAIRHVAVVRYDAFAEMGGRMSFSAALLDDAGDGLVFTAINGRSETRSYAKGVKTGSSDSPLSPEEQQAIGFALRGTDVGSRRARQQQPDQDQPVG